MMASYVIATPESLAAGAASLSGIGSAIGQAGAAAAATTTQVLPAAGDEVSAAIAKLFGSYSQEYHAIMPLPINGRPKSSSVGALMTPSNPCSRACRVTRWRPRRPHRRRRPR
jgi:hypothetical protein